MSKIRITLARDGSLEVHASPASALPYPDPAAASQYDVSSGLTQSVISKFGPILDIYLDTCCTPSSIFTRTKTTHRPEYSAARSRIGVPPLPTPSNSDVLLFNESDELTETSIRNIAFLRGTPPRWVTPRADTGCLPGVMRRWLIEHDRVVLAHEEEIRRESLKDGEYVLTFNGVEGCRFGRIVLHKAIECVFSVCPTIIITSPADI